MTAAERRGEVVPEGTGRGGAAADTRPAGYGVGEGATRHPPGLASTPVPTVAVLGLAIATTLGVWTRDPRPVGMLAGGVALAWLVTHDTAGPRIRCLAWCLTAIVLAAAGAARSDDEWRGVAPDRIGEFGGWAKVVGDPQPFESSTRIIMEVEGERFETWARGRAFRQRVSRWQGGQWVQISATRVELDPRRARRVAWQHVVGRLDVGWASDELPGGPLDRASNRVRRAIERAASHLPPDDGALFRGLVVGDDRDQSAATVRRFRASGLSHLTAVSGQNVAFVLAAAGPLLARLRPVPRWLATLAMVAWFVSLTRFEPSIVRAGAMAGLSATAFLLGAVRSPLRNLGLAVTVLVLLDPLIVWSVGFWLSVGATFGVTTIGPWLGLRLGMLGRLATPVGITLGAQAGVALPSLMVFGRLPLVSVPANVFAVPVAGAVMLYGLPAGLLAGAIDPLAPVLMAPARFGTRWVDTVAAVAARLEPTPGWSLAGWLVLLAGLVAVARRPTR